MSCVFGTHASSNTLQVHKINEIILLRDSEISMAVYFSHLAYKAVHDGGR